MAVYRVKPSVSLDELVTRLNIEMNQLIKEPNDKELEERINRTKELIINCVLVNKDKHELLDRIYF